MSTLEIYKELYFHDFERRDEINNSTTIIFGALPIIFAAGIALAKEIDAPFDNYELWTLCLLGLTLIPLLAAFFYLTKAYIGYGYSYIPYAQDLRDYENSLKTYYESIGLNTQDVKEKTEEEINEYLSNKYSEYSKINQTNNERKLGMRYKGVNSIVVSTVLLIASGIPYAVNSVSQSEVQKVEISNVKEIVMATQGPKQPNQNQAQPQPQPKPQPQPVKPSAPPGRIVQESYTPPKK